MALIDKASLLMVPSVYEDGTLYNVLPSGNKAPDETGNHNGYDQTRADFTFSRGSNLTATRVNASGLIEKGRENLLLQSNNFATTWLNSNTTETGGQSGYDGTNNAWLLSKSAANAYIYQNNTLDGVQTFSVYAKAGTLSWMRFVVLGTGFASGYFNLSDGSLGSISNDSITSSSENIGNGWYRFTLVLNASTSQVRIYPAKGNNDASGTSGNIYIQNAQREKGLVSTPYIETGATTATAGVLENTPRIDYSSGAGALLLEPQRTNVLAYSEYYAGYPQTRITLTHNSTTSPEGFINATKMVETTDNGLHFLAITGSVTSSANAAFSIFAKQGENQFLQVLFGTAQTSPDAYANVDLSNGTYNDYNMVSFDTEDYGNGWYRVFGVVNSLTTSLGFYIASVQSKTAARAETYAGDGASGFYIYGAQMESSASYPSSYVPTYGSAATRGADDCNNTSASAIIGQTEGTLYVEVDFEDNDSDGMFMTISDGTSANRLHIGYDYTSDWIYCNVKASNLQQALLTSVSPTDGLKKIAVAYKQNDFVMYINGTQVAADTNANVPTTNRIDIGGYFSAGFEHPVKQNLLFKTRLTNAELAALTA